MRVSELRAKRIIAEEFATYDGGSAAIDGNLVVGDSAFTVAAATGNTSTGTLTAAGLVGAAEGVQLAATAAEGVTVLLQDASGDALLATGTTVPTNDTAGFAKGCLFIDTDVAKGTTGLNCNKGTSAECTFTAVTQA
jgi:hypothetical protein